MQCGFFLTAIWTFLLIQNDVQLSKVFATRPPGYLDFDNLPETNFTCEGKVIGGYYADIETGCQMFHVCTIGQKGDMTDIKFLCLNGTVFDQETRVCERVDEVDCSKSKDFYDLNLELYNNGFVLSEEDGAVEGSKSDESSEEDYDENYEIETEEPPQPPPPPATTTKVTSASTTTTTTTTTTTPKPIIFTTFKPNYNVYKNRNPSGHPFIPYDNKGPIKPVIRGPTPTYPGIIVTKLENKNVGTHLTGILPPKNLQTPRPYLDTGLKPPVNTYVPSSKPPSFEGFKNHYFPSSTPITSILINNYKEDVHSSEQGKRPVVVVSHHFPTITPLKSNYEDYAFALRHRQDTRPTIKIQHHQPNPTILALQSQQKKVHQLHQEGLEIAEHQIAQIASRNAEISNLRSQKMEDRKDYFEPTYRETKEIHAEPAIAIVTQTSSTSSRVQNRPIVKISKVTSQTEYKSHLEKLFEQKKEEEEEDEEEEGESSDLEQLLLAWKLKTNQEVTKEDIERVFSSLDTSKFKNGQTISLSDIFKIMNNASSEETTRVPPISYDDYTEEDVPYDPFYKDVPKVTRVQRSADEEVKVRIRDNGRFVGKKKAKNHELIIADVKLLTDSSEATSGFTCKGKAPGGIYEDFPSNCRVFHLCLADDTGRLQDRRLACEDGTKFSEESMTCEPEKLVECRRDRKGRRKREDLFPS